MIALLVAGLLLFGAGAVFWQLRAIRRGETAPAAGVAEAFDRRDVDAAAKARPVSETRPGTDFAELDALELLYSIPAHDPELAAGRARLQQAIDDDIKGDQP